MLLERVLGLHDADGQAGAEQVPWDQVGGIARRYVERESPNSVWPYHRISPSALHEDPRTVLIHYFPFFELSFDNVDLSHDHWTKFVKPARIAGRFGKVGGLARERPLTPPPWPSAFWREINAAVDILRAQQIGADGFGLDIPEIGSGRHVDQVHILCEAAAALAPDFKIALEPGMAALGAVSAVDLADELSFLASSPAVDHLIDRKLLVIPFAADLKPVSFWREVIDRLQQNGGRVAFVPDFLDLMGHAEQFRNLSYGETLWGPRDPVQAESLFLLKAESRFRAQVTAWMAPVAPQAVSPKVALFWEARNTELFRVLWTQAINGPSLYAHILTWNDYSESTEIQPSSGTQFLFYDLCAFYIQWFKTREQPTIIEDALYYSHRTEIYQNGERSKDDDQPFKLMGKTPISNDIEIVALLKKPAIVEIELDGRTIRQSGDKVAVLRMPALVGRPVFRIYRDGIIVVEKSSDWIIEGREVIANPVYFGGSTTRAFVGV